MWKCKKCAEENEDSFDTCWSCGTAQDGSQTSDTNRVWSAKEDAVKSDYYTNKGETMSAVKQISGEKELARIQGTKMSSLFTATATRVVLTNKRVYQEITEGVHEEACIIPLKNVDSFGLSASSKTWLLVIGVIIALFGFYSLKTSYSKDMAFFTVLIGGGFIAAWWFTRKIGAVVHSLSGKTELFVQASAQNRDDIANFIARIQESLDETNAVNKTNP